MKNALNNQVGMLGDMLVWLVANLKQGVIYFIEQACGNDILASVYIVDFLFTIYDEMITKKRRADFYRPLFWTYVPFCGLPLEL